MNGRSLPLATDHDASHDGELRRPHVLHVMARMATAGTERQLVGMLRAAHGKLWDAHLCVLFPGSPLTAEVREFMPVTELRFERPADPRRPVALRRLARRLNVDVVHSSLWGASMVTRVALAGRCRPPIVMSERRVEDFRPRWTLRVDAALRPMTDAWIGNSDDVVDFVRRAHGAPADRVFCIRNGIDGGVFRPGADGARRPGGPRIGGVGRLVPEKRWPDAVKAMSAVLRSFPDASLRIAGEGPGRDDLVRSARGLPVDLVGLLSSPAAVAEFMRDLDVLVLPSEFEGLPNVLLEAQACGVPVVASDAPGIAEALGSSARLFPAGDVAALAAAVIEALESEDKGVPPAVHDFHAVAAGHLTVFRSACRSREAAA